MIRWGYKNADGVSPERIEEAKQIFIRKIGPYKQEFEDNEGYVEIIFDGPPEVGAKYSFQVKENLSDFIKKVNLYIEDDLYT